MDKEKVIELVTGIAERGYDAGLCSSPNQRESVQDIEDLIISELNSKPVMPKVFDEWYKGSSYNDPDTPKFKIIHFTTMAMFGGKGIQKDEQLCKWIMKDKHGDKYAYDEKRFIRCMEAIIHGYEVEK